MTEYFQFFAFTKNLILGVLLLISIITFVVVLLSKHSEAQKWMLIASIGVVIYFSSNLTPTDDHMIARKLIYISTFWLSLGAVMGLMDICEVKAPSLLKIVTIIINILMSISVTTINYHDGWEWSRLIADPSNPQIMVEDKGYGWMYYLINICLVSMLFFIAVYMLFKLSHRKGSKRRALTFLAVFISIPSIVWVFSSIMGFSTTYSNFVLISGLDTTILILQIHYNILTTIPVAKEQIVEASDEGIIILDGKERFLYANQTAKNIFEELKKPNEDKITLFIKEKLLTLEQNAKIEMNDKYYSFYVEDVMETGRHVGKTLWMKNITTEVNYSNMMLKRSETDLMTGLLNRGGGEKRISDLLDQKTPGMFCLLDADHFKSFNDNFGHAVGDTVIIAISDALKSSLDSEISTIMRLGGDEFAFYVKGISSKDEGSKTVEKIFSTISETRIDKTEGRPIYLSFGAVIYNGFAPISFDELYNAADKGTYASKHHEGNFISFTELNNK